jgi:mRNA-degrading endonuclease RelE of RelBE toxin-antitoxin system
MTLRVDRLPRAERDGRNLDKNVRDRIRSAIERFAETGHGVIFKLYPSEQRIEIVRILPRGKAYRVRETAEVAA